MSSLSDAQVSFQQPLTFVDCSPGVFAALFAADLNSDGRADLLCSDGTLNLGNGDGTFKLGSPISTENSQGIAAVADFNGDGKPDVLETSPNGALLVLLGSGDGTFQKPVSSPGVIFQPLAAVDLNGDGKSDVVGVPPGNGSLNVCISNGNGTFRACVPYSLGTAGYDSAVAVADFNGDGKPDVAVYTAAQVLVFFGNGDVTLEAPKTSTAPTYDSFTCNTFYLVAGDFNGDGKVDLAIGAGCGTQVCPVTAYTLLGNGDGAFQTPRANTFNTVPFVQVDLDGDGKADLISAGTPTIAQVYLGQADGTFSLEHTYVTTFSASIFTTTTIATADFDSDGKADIASAGGVLLGKGDGTFQGLPFSSGFTGYPVVGDFEKIGRPDLALATTGATTTIYVTHNNGDGTFSLIHTYSAPEGTIVAGDASFMEGDVNGDGNLDFVVIGEDPASNQYEYSVFIGNADGTFQQPVSYMPGMLGIGSGSAVIADLNNDDKLDLVKLGGDQISGSTILTVLLGNGDGTFSTPVTYYPGGSNPGGSASLLLGDFNGDGKTDIAISNIGLGTNVLYGNGDGTFQPSVIPAQLSSFSAFMDPDLRNNGQTDLIGYDGASSVVVALNNGNGTFTFLPALSSIPLQFGDVNGDGRPDFFAQLVNNQACPMGVELGNGDGTFGPAINLGCVPEFNLIADVNGDGRPDLISPWINGIAVELSIIAPDFSVAPASGYSTSQTVTAGQSANFSLAIDSTGSFTGIVSLSCAVTPVVSPAPTCALSSSSVQIRGSGPQTLTVKVGTTGAVTSNIMLHSMFPNWLRPLAYLLIVMGLAWLWAGNSKRKLSLARPIVVIAFLFSLGCGGSGSSSSTHTTPGTPAGTYTATVTANCGSTSHNIALHVIVQ